MFWVHHKKNVENTLKPIEFIRHSKCQLCAKIKFSRKEVQTTTQLRTGHSLTQIAKIDCVQKQLKYLL